MDFHYTVEGQWPFPTDMLRRDNSQAATPFDQEKIDLLSSEHAPDLGTMLDTHTINLIIPNAGRQRPNTARWESFCWKVPTEAEYYASKNREQEQTALVKQGKTIYDNLSIEDRNALDEYYRYNWVI